MAASKPRTFRLSHALSDAIELRAKELDYPSATALIEALDGKLLDRVLRKKGMKASDAAKVDWRTL